MAFPTSVNDQITDSVTQKHDRTDHMLEVLEAYRRGEKVEARLRGGTYWETWVPPLFNFCGFEYRIAKPKPKKIKMYAFIIKASGALIFASHSDPFSGFYRVPQFDCEVEE